MIEQPLLSDAFNSVYRTAFERIDQGFCLLEKLSTPADTPPNFRYLLTNSAFEQQSGLQQVVGKTIRQVVPGVEEHILAFYDQVARTGEPVYFETYVSTLDRWIDTHAFRINEHNPVQIAVLFTDITARRQAEEALRESEQRLRLFVAASSDIVYRMSADWQQMEQLAGKEFLVDTQTVNQSWLEQYIPADDQLSVQAVIQAAIHTKSLFELEHRVIQADGQVGWIFSRAIPLRTEQGTIQEWFGAASNITERKKAEEALRESEKNYRLTIEAARMGTWDWNLVTNEVIWNEEHFRLFGMQTQPNPMSPNVYMEHVHPDGREGVDRMLQAAIADRGVFDTEFCALLDDGSQRWMSGYGRVVEEVDGRATRMSGVMFDIDTRKRAEEALKEADRRKNEFLAMLAHELRNPMATLRNGLNILKVHHEAGSVPGQTVSMMNRQLDHLVRLVDDLLDVSRISQGKIELKRERIELGNLVAGAVDAIRPLYATQHKTLHLTDSPSPLFVHGDATRLSQIVSNLLTNGVRYTGDQGQVRLSLRAEQRQAVLRVADNGIGLAEDQLTAIFELFVQVDTSLARSQGGLGIGLTLVHRLVELHGGRVEAHSPGPGQGSEFVVYLPLLDEPTDAQTSGPTDSPMKTAGHRILVIDDNADAALTLSMLLKLEGYKVSMQHSGQAGIQAAEQLRPRVILCDISMPRMDGYETSRLIRAQPWGESVTLIALTGYGQEEDKRRTKAAGFDNHLVKPIDIEVLRRLLNELPA